MLHPGWGLFPPLGKKQQSQTHRCIPSPPASVWIVSTTTASLGAKRALAAAFSNNSPAGSKPAHKIEDM